MEVYVSIISKEQVTKSPNPGAALSMIATATLSGARVEKRGEVGLEHRS